MLDAVSFGTITGHSLHERLNNGEGTSFPVKLRCGKGDPLSRSYRKRHKTT
jgi:hypothetical protein